MHVHASLCKPLFIYCEGKEHAIRSTKFYEQTLKDLLKYTRRGSKEIKENENKEEEEDEVEKNKEEEQERISSLRKRMENVDIEEETQENERQEMMKIIRISGTS
ncbi:uncharacterized protein LOC141531531 isoform X3 [Cotesia typhae]|uniref:uncharacterized protein LOC141531531 isoform X3 n=1 Tax=Cotesia typhae TaxID=2053667 RepID=UPI003D692ABE